MAMHLRHSGTIAQAPHVYRLPVETLALIFEIGTHGSGDPNDATDFPMLVSAVSRHFRSVAIQTPNLWSTIIFDSPRPPWYDSNPDEEYEYTYSRDLLWISRSKACPLNLILSYRDRAWKFVENRHYFRREHMETIISLLSPHASRIQRFTLICDTFAPLHVALRFLAEHGPVMDNIQSLELYRCNEFLAEHSVFSPGELAHPIPLLGGCRAPQLTHVILSGVHVNWSRSQVPLSNLQTLELAFHPRSVRPSALEFIQIVDASPHLTSLTVTASGPCTPFTTAPDHSRPPSLGDGLPRIHLPLLRTLEIGYQNAVDAVALLDLIDAPSVVELAIADTSRPSEDETDGGSFVLEALAVPSRKRFPLLGMLSLRAVTATAKAFTVCLDSHPGLHTLKLSNVSREVLYVISSPSPSSPSNPPCPALRHLSLQFMSHANVGSIARARAAAGMPIAELFIHVCDEISDEEIALAEQYSGLVTYFGDDSDDSDVMDWGENDDPYAPGGAFNDPEFDSMFT